jgi:hypothetical protein
VVTVPSHLARALEDLRADQPEEADAERS